MGSTPPPAPTPAPTRQVRHAPTLSNVATPPPAWLEDLSKAFRSILMRALDFNKAMDVRRKLQHDGNQEIQVLHLLSAVLKLTIDHPSQDTSVLHPSEKASLERLGIPLQALTQTTTDPMFNKVFETLRPADASAALTLGNDILASIHDATFIGLVKKIVATFDQTGTTVFMQTFNSLCDALSFAYLALFDSPLQDSVTADFQPVSDAVSAIGKKLITPAQLAKIRAVDAPLGDGIDALPSVPLPADTAVGVIASILTIPGMVVGNVAGPNTLMIAVLRWRNSIQAAALVSQFNKAVGAINIAKSIAGDLPLAMAMIPGTDADREALNAIALKIINGEKPTASDSTAFLDNADLKIAGTMSSRLWVSGIGILNSALLFCSFYHMIKNGANLNDVMSATGQGLGLVATGASALELMGKITARSLANAGKIIGGLGAIIAVGQFVIAFHSALTNTGTMQDAVLSGISAAGMIILEASLFMGAGSPIAAGVGGVLVIGSALASIVLDPNFPDNLENVFRSTSERWWLAMEKFFENGAVFKAASAVNNTLATQATALRTAITNTSFLLIDATRRSALAPMVDATGMEALAAAPP